MCIVLLCPQLVLLLRIYHTLIKLKMIKKIVVIVIITVGIFAENFAGFVVFPERKYLCPSLTNSWRLFTGVH